MSQRVNLSPKDRLHTFVGNLDPTLRKYVILGSPQTCEEAERAARLKSSTNIYNKKKDVIEILKNASEANFSSRANPSVAAAEVDYAQPRSNFSSLGGGGAWTQVK